MMDMQQRPTSGWAKMLVSGSYKNEAVQFMVGGRVVDVYEWEITDDLPADAIGEGMCEALQAMRKSGYDLTTLVVTVQFE